MTPAEERFRAAVRRVVAGGYYPSALMIKIELKRRLRGRGAPGGEYLNGRETRWREDELERLGWTRLSGYGSKAKPRYQWLRPGEVSA